MPDPRPIRDRFDPPQAPDEVGRFGKYRVVKQLGAGGMGAVFDAEDTFLGRPVALKFMAPDLAAKPDSRERFLREARAAFRVKSEHVVEIYEVDERGGLPYIAMERLRGQSLDDFLDRKGLPALGQVVRIGREVAEGLAAAHAAGLVHRDIKPSNVWLEAPKGRVKLIDFGLAYQDRADTRLTVSGSLVGTPEYMAPEQASGQPVDGRADLFSLGVMLYRLTTGQRPFAGPTVMASLAAVLTANPPPPAAVNPRVSPPLSDLIVGLMAKDPAARPPTARWVADALGRMAADVPTAMAVSAAASAPEYPVPLSGAGAMSGSYPVPVSNAPTPADPWRHLDATPAPAALAPRTRPTPALKPWLWAAAGLAGGLLFFGLLAVGFLATRGRTAKPTPTGDTAAGTPAEKATPLKAPFTAAEAKAAQAAWAKHLGRPVEEAIDLPGGVKMDLVLIPPGAFTMGSPADEPWRDPDEAPHPVEITKPFYLGKYEVTQEEYKAVTGAQPSRFIGPRHPVEMVSHARAAEFCAKLTTRAGPATLPTEAEWEYACRAGTTTPFHFGSTLNGSQANCDGTLPYGTAAKGPNLGRTAEVGRYRPNAFGLYDMHGNVREWCQDCYGPYSAVTRRTDPVQQSASGPDDRRVARGGSWFYDAKSTRAAYRIGRPPAVGSETDGFRVAVRLD